MQTLYIFLNSVQKRCLEYYQTMKITQAPHYLQPNPTIRQNAHINSELIKNNIQQINHNRVNSLSPPTSPNLNAVNFRPIQMVNHPIVNGAHVFQYNPTQPFHNSSNMYGGRNVPAPGPSHVMKMEQVNRSNSSSRLISQGSRIQYLSIAGNSTKDLNLNQGSVNKQVSPHSSPYFVQNPQTIRPVMANMNAMVQRPPSNASVQSSQSRNTKSISNAQIHSNQINTVQQFKFPHGVGFNNMRPSANVNALQISNNMHNMNAQNQMPRNSPPAINMRTSQVKILYQRGSFSPNEANSQNEAEFQNPLVQRINNMNNNQPIMAGNKNKEAYEIGREQIKQWKSVENSQHKLQNKNKIQNKNIRQIVKQIKSTAVESIIVGDNRLSNIQSNSKSSLSSNQMQSQQIVTANMANQNKLPIKAINSNESNSNNNGNIPNKVSISNINHKIAALKEQNRPSIEVIPEVSSNDSIYSKNQTKHLINQPSLQPIIQEQKPVVIQSRNTQPKQEVYKKVYKSYEQYLEETKKPQKLIKQFQQSESKTHVQIQYRKAPTMNSNNRKEERKQMQSESQVYKSVSIPDVYGNADISRKQYQNFNTETKTNNHVNINANIHQAQQYGYNQINTYSNNNYNAINSNSYNAVILQNNPRHKEKQLPENNLQLQNISTIKEQSQEYDNDGSYNASSMIGSTLQDNLRGISNSQNKDLSDYQFDSWVKNKYQNVFTKNNNNMDLNMLSNLTNNEKLQCINPFDKINQVKVIEQQKKQDNRLVNIQTSGYNQHKQNNIERGLNNDINNDSNYKDTYEKYNYNTRGLPISQSKSPDNKESSYYNYHIQTIDTKNQISYNNMSTKDKLISQKILGEGTTSRVTPIMKSNQNNMRTQRQRHSQKQIRQQKYVQNEEQNDANEEISFDIYELIDDVYNRELQNGINKIRQAFGKAIRVNYSQY